MHAHRRHRRAVQLRLYSPGHRQPAVFPGGGNLQLNPEKADTYSVGVTFTPASVPGLSASIDYYQIKLTDEIGAIPPALLLQECLNTADPFFCSKIVRNVANGGLIGSTIAGGPSYNCAGLYGGICLTVDPRWRLNLRTTWTMPWNLELSGDLALHRQGVARQ